METVDSHKIILNHMRSLYPVLIFVLSIADSSSVLAQNVNYLNGQNPSQVIESTAISKLHLIAGNSSNFNGSSQIIGEKCQQSDKDENLKSILPGYEAARERAKETRRTIEVQLASSQRSTPPIYTIPVVFHVIHKGENVGSGTNISDAQIMSSIDALNRDYRRASADGGIAQGAGPDTEIQFCLASVNESGNPTSGINRVNGTGVSQYSAQGITNSNELSVKDLSRWDNRYYLNIWVVSEIDNNGADVSNPADFFGGTLGYAYLPVNPVTFNSDRDGVVAINLCVGNDPNQSNGYRLWPWGGLTNRTVTHEVGHFLDLNHTFEGQSCSESNCATQGDEVCDTPPTQQGSSCNSAICTGAIIENYMDYTGEECQDMFTEGQSTRMRASLAGERNALVNTSNCAASGVDWDASVSNILSPNGALCISTFTPQVTLTNNGGNTLSSVSLQYFVDGNAATSFGWTGSLSSGASTTFNLPAVTTTNGAHSFTATTVSGTLNGSNNDQDTSNDGMTSNFSVSGGGSGITLTLDLDCYGEEITWDIMDENSNVVASGGPYVNNTNGEQVVSSLCLAEGCYDFNISDTYGDGLFGSQWTCTLDGDYSIDGPSDNLVSMTAANGDFGFGTTHNFCIGTPPPVSDCDTLVYFNGSGFNINDGDSTAFDVQALDNDGETVSTTLANAGYTSNWMVFYEVPTPGDTNLFSRSTSWHADPTAPSDNWLTFGPMTIPSGGAELSWNHRMPDNDFRDGYEVLVGTSGTEIADFNSATSLFSVNDNDVSTDGDTTWTANSVDFPAGTYAGQSVYLAFHHAALDMFFLDLDEIYMEGCTSVPVTITEAIQLQMAVFPNPSAGTFMVSYATDNGRLTDLKVLDALGRTVIVQALNKDNGQTSLDLSDFENGVYTLVLQGNSELKTTRIVLQK
jgi:hypothetical protein